MPTGRRLWNGEYFVQRLDDVDKYPYQHGLGCLSGHVNAQRASVLGDEARSMASFAPRLAATGFRWDLPAGVRSFAPTLLAGDEFRAPFFAGREWVL